MKRRLLAPQAGQAAVELALVSFLFVLFLLGVMQLALLGSAKLKCELAARRAAWLQSNFNNLTFKPDHLKQVAGLLQQDIPAPGAGSGNREEGKITTVTCRVPAVGFFRFFRPQGFTVSARSAVISFAPRPTARKIVDKGVQGIIDFFGSLSGQ